MLTYSATKIIVVIHISVALTAAGPCVSGTESSHPEFASPMEAQSNSESEYSTGNGAIYAAFPSDARKHRALLEEKTDEIRFSITLF